MTHGEELSSEMQQDSIVLTYLEGLLMHQAAGGSGTAVDKHSVGRAKADENFKISGNLYSHSQSNAPVHSSSPCQGSGMLHLKKARLLQSSEDWNAAKRRRLSDTVVAINGKNEALLAGMAENVPKGKQDSTLLASLLQSFSSRLQSVALSQQIKQSLKDQGFSISQDAAHEEKDSRCYGAASSHLKTILNKSKAKDKTADNHLTGLVKNVHHEKFSEPTLSGQSISKAAGEPVSCAARLQAVASMVEKRSSPTSSPKPSVACSQLALLLSSEAHLQQYSREHALKAQSASQLASERLAAMARLKESSENNMSRFKFSANLPANHNSPSRPLSNGISNAGNISPFPNQLSIPHSPHKPVVYRNHTDRNHVKPSPSSSLLLHLLKSHNATGVSTSHLQGDKYSMFEESATPTTTDDFSDNNPSFTEEESSDDESTHSNCAPIDLSFKNKVDKPETIQTASIDNLTESLLHNWDPKVNGLDLGRDHKDTSADSTLKPYQKVTLLQLLLGHKVDENPQSAVDLRGPQKAADVSKFSLPAHNHLPDNTSIGNCSPLNSLPLHGSSKPDVPVNLSQQPFQMKPSYTSYLNKVQSETLANSASKHLIELTRNKTFQPPVPLTNENTPNNAFSASKLLQNLAQCGMQTPTPEEQLPKQLNVSNGKTVGLVDRLRCPLVINQSDSFDEGKTFTSPPTPVDSGLPSSEIENLLERRTVLQLLLGAPNKGKNERVQKTVIKNESLQDPDENIPSEQIVTLKIKTEPEDDSNTHHFREMGAMSPLDVSVHKLARSTPEDTKQLSPHDFSGTRNGLLSRLLRQNHDGYDANDLDINRHCESKTTEPKIHCVLPKKRKMPQCEPVESQVKTAKLGSPHGGNHHLVGPRFGHEEVNGNKADHETRCTVGQSSLNEKSVCWSRESKGFNVLKQLLLSENCVRDLSQHRSHIMDEEEMKGSRNNLAGNSDAVPSLNVLMGKHPHTNNLGQMTFQYQSSLRHSPLTPPEVSGNKMSLVNSGHLNMCPVPNDKGPIKWVITGVDKNEFGKDSPRLTKTNPILYYMLQKGAHSAASQDLRDRNSWSESLLGKSNEMTFKKEPMGSRHASTNGTASHSVNTTIHNSNGEKYGHYDMLSIKKEPE